MSPRIDDPGPSSVADALARFFFSALFGAGVSLFLACAVGWLVPVSWWTSCMVHVLWVVPLVWGILGIFWFDVMLRAASELIEEGIGWQR